MQFEYSNIGRKYGIYSRWTGALDVFKVTGSVKVDDIHRGAAVREGQSLSCGCSRGYGDSSPYGLGKPVLWGGCAYGAGYCAEGYGL